MDQNFEQQGNEKNRGKLEVKHVLQKIKIRICIVNYETIS